MFRRFTTAVNRRRSLVRPLFAASAILAQLGVAIAVSGWPHETAPPAQAGSARTPVAPSETTTSEVTTTSTSTSTTSSTTTSTSLTSTTVAPTTTQSTAPPTTRAPEPVAAAVPLPPPPSGGVGPYVGLGTWVDVFDFNPAHTGGSPTVVPSDVDRMAAVGVRTLYLQAARPEDPKAPGDLVSPELLADFLVRAHARGMHVVAWYLPHLTNVDDDMRHLAAMLAFNASGHQFDSISLDIEWRAGVADHGARSQQLVDLSQRLRTAAGDRSVSATVMPPVVTDVINPNFWPGFPWDRLAPLYNAWLPMSYWTNRSAGTPYRDAYRYTVDNVNLVRQHVGSGAAVHPIGGIGNAATADDYASFRQAAADTGSVGLSIYDWATTAPDAYAILR